MSITVQVVGDETTFPPIWLQKACSRRSWGYVTPSYRLLPEAKGADVLQDAYDAAIWTLKNLSGRLIIAGSSAGGNLAFYVANRLAAEGKPPVAVLSLYGMLDITKNPYVTPGRTLMNQPLVTEFGRVILEIESAKNYQALRGYRFPPSPQDVRMVWVNAIHQAAMYPDLIADLPGLSARIRQEGLRAIPADCQDRFPLAFELAADFPPTVLIHGANDLAVDMSQSSDAAAKLEENQVKVLLQLVEGAGHGFDVRNISPDIEIEEIDNPSPPIKALQQTINFLGELVCS